MIYQCSKIRICNIAPSLILLIIDYQLLNVKISFFFFLVSCETKTWGLDTLLRILGQKRAKALVAVLDSPMCEVTIKLAHLWNMPLFTWTCPLVSKSLYTICIHSCIHSCIHLISFLLISFLYQRIEKIFYNFFYNKKIYNKIKNIYL